jgi:hypothetical protein
MNNNNSVINNDYEGVKELILRFKIPMGTRNNLFRNLWIIWTRALKKLCKPLS